MNTCLSTSYEMNKIFLTIVICFLTNTQGSPRTRRALPPGYLSVDGTEQCLESERMPGTSSSYLCIPARKPWCCPQGVWNNLSSESLGLVRCQMTNLDPCGESLKNNWLKHGAEQLLEKSEIENCRIMCDEIVQIKPIPQRSSYYKQSHCWLCKWCYPSLSL